MRFFIAIFTLPLLCFAENQESREERITALLSSGDYKLAIIELESVYAGSEDQFALGLLYAYREIEERGDGANFTEAIRLIRLASADNQEAKGLLEDHAKRGDVIFFAFPWAHLIGPFPKLTRPAPHQDEK